LTIIAFIGSVFSPYYAWAGRRDPLDHCAFNVALYGPRGSLWAMTERRRSSVVRTRDTLAIGRTTTNWDGSGLVLNVDERAAPIPRRIRGRITIRPEAINPLPFLLEDQGQHWWRPLAPRARVEVEMEAPAHRWRGSGYFDQNAGNEPLERAFSQWTWSRAAPRSGASVVYDAIRRREPPLSLALAFDRSAGFDERPRPPLARLPRTRWGLARTTRADEGRANVVRSLEDTPFYSRGLVAHELFGERVNSVHESLSLDRFANPLVRVMLPFRMPRI
jgi:carotenoid 1,2-hydratase